MFLRVKVHASAHEEKIEKRGLDHWDIAVREPAERNEANRRVLTLVAEELNMPIGKVRMISGHHSPSKILSVGS